VFVGPLFRFAHESLVFLVRLECTQRGFCVGDCPTDHECLGVERENVEKASLELGRHTKSHHCTTENDQGSVLMSDTVMDTPGNNAPNSVAARESHSHSAAQ